MFTRGDSRDRSRGRSRDRSPRRSSRVNSALRARLEFGSLRSRRCDHVDQRTERMVVYDEKRSSSYRIVNSFISSSRRVGGTASSVYPIPTNLVCPRRFDVINQPPNHVRLLKVVSQTSRKQQYGSGVTRISFYGGINLT